MTARAVYYVSDSTGMTVEELGRSVLTHFASVDFKEETLPFVDDEAKADAVAEKIRAAAAAGARPIVFCSFGKQGGARRQKFVDAGALALDCLEVFLRPLEQELGSAAKRFAGRRQGRSEAYARRIEALNFTMDHDDGASLKRLEVADIILVGVSRSGKTPTCLHLALHYGVFAANYPLVEEDLQSEELPRPLRAHAGKLYGLSIAAERLAQIRNQRLPDSKYAALSNCRQEVAACLRILEANNIPRMDVTQRSVEELAAKIMQAAGLARHL